MQKRLAQSYLVWVTAIGLLTPSGAVSASPPSEQQFVWLSDIHFDPLADPTLTNQLAAAEVSQWQSILASSSSTKFSQFGEDSNWLLLSSAVQEIKKTVPNPALTLVTGDLLVHHFREHFDRAASAHDDAAFYQFVRKTTEFVALQLKQIAPSKPVFISLGNNDSECGDYLLQPNGPFLNSTRPLVADLLKVSDDPSLDDWVKYGVYSAPHPTLRHYRMVAVNTVLFSARYRDACGNTPHDDPGEKMMAWLDAELANAKQNHEKVWLIYHIPPGIDGFATTRHDDTPVLFWKAPYAESFDRLLSRYRGTIAASFAGHTHTDDFRLAGADGKQKSLVLMTPALSPLVKQNPAFRVVQFRNNGALTDQVTYYVSSLTTAPEWKREYSFDQMWNFRQLNLKSFDKLYRHIDASSEARQRWSLFYSVSHPEGGSITPESYWALHCASGHTTISDYQACLSAQGTTAGKR